MPISFVDSIKQANYEEVQQYIYQDPTLLLKEIDGDIPAIYALKNLKAGFFESERNVKNVQRFLFNETMIYKALANKEVLEPIEHILKLLLEIGLKEMTENRDELYEAIYTDNYEKVRKFIILNPKLITTEFTRYATYPIYPLNLVRNNLKPDTKSYQYILDMTAIYFFSNTFEINLTKDDRAEIAFAAAIMGIPELKSTAAKLFNNGVLFKDNELKDFESHWQSKMLQCREAIEQFNEKAKIKYQASILRIHIQEKELDRIKVLIEQNPRLLVEEVEGELPYEMAYLVGIFNKNPGQISRMRNDVFRYVFNETLILEKRLNAKLNPDDRDLKAIRTLKKAFSKRPSFDLTFYEFLRGLKEYNHEKVRLYVLLDFTWLIREESSNDFTFALDLLIEENCYRKETKEFLIEQTALGFIKALTDSSEDSKFFTLEKFIYLKNFMLIFERAKGILYSQNTDENFETLFMEKMVSIPKTVSDSKMISYYLDNVRKKTNENVFLSPQNTGANDNNEGRLTKPLAHSTLFSTTWIVASNREKAECNANKYLDERLDQDLVLPTFTFKS